MRLFDSFTAFLRVIGFERTFRPPVSGDLQIVKTIDLASEKFPDFAHAFEAVNSKAPVIFISGKAGTGKSTFLRELKRRSRKHFAVVAPTGLAALNVDGQTIHSFFKLPTRPVSIAELKRREPDPLLNRLQLLVVDEVSMVRADLLDNIDTLLRFNRGRPRELFGGVQVVFIGDLFQLPPVLTDRERRMFETRYSSPYFFAAQCLQDQPICFVELTKVFRQKDPYFTDLLGKIREGSDVSYAVSELNQAGMRDVLPNEHPVVLACTHADADAINQLALNSLTTGEICYQGIVSGKRSMDMARFPSPVNLRIKKGARVMFTANDPDSRWVNGSTGRVLRALPYEIEVELSTSGKRVFVSRHTWDTHEYQTDEKNQRIEAKVSGSFEQFPLTYAWAITIHKSQGMTLDSVAIDRGHGAFAPGQMYVGLSRCRELGGLLLSSELKVGDIRVSREVGGFYGSMRG